MLGRVLKFLEFATSFRNVRRSIYAVGDERKENDAEHSYQLALFTTYIIDSLGLGLDKGLATQYALIHDLTEVFDGDIHIFDKQGRKKKDEIENKAMQKIKVMFPDWKAYARLSKEYMDLKNETCRLVNGLDKLLPVINIMLDGGRVWKEEGTTLKKIADNKRVTTAVHPVSRKIWKELEEYLKENEKDLFPIGK